MFFYSLNSTLQFGSPYQPDYPFGSTSDGHRRHSIGTSAASANTISASNRDRLRCGSISDEVNYSF